MFVNTECIITVHNSRIPPNSYLRPSGHSLSFPQPCTASSNICKGRQAVGPVVERLPQISMSRFSTMLEMGLGWENKLQSTSFLHSVSAWMLGFEAGGLDFCPCCDFVCFLTVSSITQNSILVFLNVHLTHYGRFKNRKSYPLHISKSKQKIAQPPLLRTWFACIHFTVLNLAASMWNVFTPCLFLDFPLNVLLTHTQVRNYIFQSALEESALRVLCKDNMYSKRIRENKFLPLGCNAEFTIHRVFSPSPSILITELL